MKLVYMGDSKSPVARRVGSSPTSGTTPFQYLTVRKDKPTIVSVFLWLKFVVSTDIALNSDPFESRLIGHFAFKLLPLFYRTRKWHYVVVFTMGGLIYFVPWVA
jgi:hypothetical protein